MHWLFSVLDSRIYSRFSNVADVLLHIHFLIGSQSSDVIAYREFCSTYSSSFRMNLKIDDIALLSLNDPRAILWLFSIEFANDQQKRRTRWRTCWYKPHRPIILQMWPSKDLAIVKVSVVVRKSSREEIFSGKYASIYCPLNVRQFYLGEREWLHDWYGEIIVPLWKIE